ncbi:hypothetical protein FBU59_006935 [Linderina macrospora]|uniref:Uncharacterized protein n=1 Tax=Linderina macrospora TaxID=4868 RepID=A0ACC1IYE1_9FUNG|nr:hypothetical protein FBU59_006935 [Linderina macrospora]
MPWYQAVELLKDCRVDPYLPSVIAWCIQHNVPMGVNLIQLVFKRNLTEQERGYLEVFSNTAEIQENGQWRITFRDDSELGHDKAATIESVRNRYASKPKVVFLGDGVSDIASAKKADYLFARRGLDLDVWCNQNNVPHESFDDFSFIAKRLEEINNSL